MDIEKLYQDVWAQVFAKYFETQDMYTAAVRAEEAAAAAVEMWDPKKAHAVIAAKAAQT